MLCAVLFCFPLLTVPTMKVMFVSGTPLEKSVGSMTKPKSEGEKVALVGTS